MNLLEHALSYAAKGWAVVPLYGIKPDGRCECGDPHTDTRNARGKHPRINEWQKNWSKDPAQIRAWFEKWPNANVGIATGEPSGFDVWDIDGEEGRETLQRLEQQHGAIPETLEQLTGSGGRHLLFTHTPGFLNGVKFLPGIDLRTTGGQIVVEPSLHHSGRRYAFEVTKTAVLAAPPWALTLQPRPKPAVENAVHRVHGVNIDRARAYLAKIPAGVSGQNGSSPCFRAACVLIHGFNLNPEQALSLLVTDYSPRCTPPWTEDELRHKVEDAAKQPGLKAAVKTDQIVVGTDMGRVIEEAENALLAHSPIPLYQHTGRIATVVRDGERCPEWFNRPLGSPVVFTVNSAHVRRLMADSAAWKKVNGDKLLPTLPPAWACDGLLSAGAWRFPMLSAISQTPTFRPDGTLIDRPGLDPETGVLYVPSAEFPPVPENPTREQAIECYQDLCEPFSEFPWDESHDLSATISALLTLIARPAIQGPVPMYGIKAPTRGSGKTLIVELLGQIATGAKPPVMLPTNDDEETRKRIMALALEGATLVLIDNVEGAIGSAPLAGLITGEAVKDRVLGESRTGSSPWRGVLFATGNNITFKGDIGRRVLPIDIDPKCEFPEKRRFQRDLATWVPGNRARLVVSALTLLRAFFLHGTKQPEPRLGKFEGWDDVVRSALVWVGAPDPCDTRTALEDEGDEDRETITAIIEAWGADPMTVAQAINSNSTLRSALCALIPDKREPETHAIGNALRRIVGRMVGGKALVRHKDDASRKVATYRVA